MSASKRDFSDFKAFPGDFKTINGNRLYAFPEITYNDSMNRTRSWQIFVRLIESKTGKAPPRSKINWELSKSSSVNLKASYYKEVPDKTIAQMWTEQGIVDGNENEKRVENKPSYAITRSIPTHILKGKNIGKTNETNVFTQALIQARSKYLKQLEQHAASSKERVFPVAVHKYEDKPRSKEKWIVYPCAVQRKLDGGRAVAYYDDESSTPVMYTRKLKDLAGNTHILDALKPLYEIINLRHFGAYLDGEIYKHGLSLQQISGIMRREAGSKTAAREAKENPDAAPVRLEYHIFDVFFPFTDDSNASLEKRLVILDDIFQTAKDSGLDLTYLKKVQTFIAKDQESETKLYEQFLEEKYEGSIVKNLDAPYEFGTQREIRSYQMRKRKPRHSAEYEIVGYTEGDQGKDKGAIIFILKTPGNKKKGIAPVQFNSAPVGIDYEERYKMFREMTEEKFKTQYLGKMMTVEYDDISEEGVPLRAKAKVVRVLD